MMKLKSFFLRFVLVAVLAVGGIHAAKAGTIQEGAQAFIEGLANKAITSLAEKELPREEREVRFRTLLNDHFAIRTIGRWVLGRYWRKAKKNEQEEFIRLFEDLMVAMYVDRFSSYAGETLSVTKTVLATKKDVIVYTQIVGPSHDTPIHADWRVRYNDKKDDFKIVDVMVEGVSMGQTQRSEFSSVIRQKGGKVSALIAELKHRIESGA